MRGSQSAYVGRMHRRSCAYWHALLLLASFAVCRAQANGAEPEPIYLRFEISAGLGIHFMTLQATVAYTRETYWISAEAKTRGVADLLLDLRSRFEVRGRVTPGALRPYVMRAETHRRGADYRTRIDYRADGNVSAEVSPPPDSRVTQAVPAQIQGTIDQLTAYLVLARAVAARRSCTLRLNVFDGRRRYDLEFADASAEPLPVFGTVQACRMTRYKIAGFPVDTAAGARSDGGKVWLARLLPGELAIPVRVEFAGEYGTFTAELAELRGHGAQLRFTE